MKATARFLSVSVFGLLMLGMEAQARPRAFQDPPPAQNPTPAQTPGRGGERRPGVLGKLTAIHDQSIEIAEQTGSTVTVKITATTQFRKDREAAKLSDFKVGDLVFVRGEENADHTWTAEMIGTRAGGGFGGRGQGGGGPEGGRAGGQGGRAGVIAQTGVLGQDYVFGEVKSIDAPKLTILRSDNVTQTIELNEETSLRKGRDSITMADIQAGDHVLVHGGMKDNAFQPKAVMVIGPEQWKRMQEMGMAGGPPANPPKDNNLQQKPPEPPH